MTDATYNGWKNYETWLVYSNIMADEVMSALMDNEVMSSEPNWAALGRSDFKLGERLYREIWNWWLFSAGPSSDAPLITRGLTFDLMRSAFDRVDWVGIIKNRRGSLTNA